MFDEKRFRQHLKEKKIKFKDLAKALNMNESTLYRKIKNNGNFTLHEINTMIDYAEIDEPMLIFFTKQLA